MTKDDLFIWAQNKSKEYPVLKKLRNEAIDGTEFLFLKGKRGGAYKGVYLFFYKNSRIDILRQCGFIAEITEDYETARDIILKCVQFSEEWESEKIKNKQNKK